MSQESRAIAILRKESIGLDDTKCRMNKILQMCDESLEGFGESAPRRLIAVIMCIGCSCFFLYTSFFGSFPNMIQRAILFMWVIPIIFMQKPIFKKPAGLALAIDCLLSLACIASMYYITYDVNGMG